MHFFKHIGLFSSENGYSRALPLRWLAAFTEKSRPVAHKPCKEWQATVSFLTWVKEQLVAAERAGQRVLMLGDSHYDNLGLWKGLPEGVFLLARSARNRVLHELPGAQSGRGRRRKYGPRALTPQEIWRQRTGWRKLNIIVRGRVRHLQVKVRGPYLRKGAPDCPLMLIVVRGKGNKRIRRQPLPFLVNAMLNEPGQWDLPLPLPDLLFWAWQRWEIEVCHRELKSSFGLGDKQC